MNTPITAEQIAHWQQWIGRTQLVTERIEGSLLRRYAAALDEPSGEDAPLPALAHWAFFLDAQPPGMLGPGPDGHPQRGGFLPPVTLPRRMFAASAMEFAVPLMAGHDAARTSRIASLTHKSGKSGELVLVEIDHEISQQGALCLRERQTIVYRDMGAAMAPVIPAETDLPDGSRTWCPGPVDLFRFSAVTFNSHRIHYDLPYAMGEEGYPALVVHGPFTAARLFAFVRDTRGMPRQFSFRATAPLFAGQPVFLCSGAGPGEVVAKRCDGTDAMIAQFQI